MASFYLPLDSFWATLHTKAISVLLLQVRFPGDLSRLRKAINNIHSIDTNIKSKIINKCALWTECVYCECVYGSTSVYMSMCVYVSAGVCTWVQACVRECRCVYVRAYGVTSLCRAALRRLSSGYPAFVSCWQLPLKYEKSNMKLQ